MSDPLSSATDYLVHLETLGVSLDALSVNARGTLVSPTTVSLARPARGDSGDVTALTGSMSTPDSEMTSLVLGEIIGQGGMGVVRVAEQRTLRRQVAVKAVREDAQGPGAADSVISEARITGAIEHPNIIPIYDLIPNLDGSPLIIMKRVEGRTWQEILDHDRKEGPLDGELLSRHLDILNHVVNALDYAHSKRIIHRDLKPDNVMVGNFGEVYLLDWGIAVSLEGGPEGVPAALDQRYISGTPDYMAPEMAAGDAEAISERTDVYLLGAVLYDLISGKPPHGGNTIIERLQRAYLSLPRTYPEGCAAELISICDTAMANLPEDRFTSVRDFQDALEDYSRNRISVELAREASIRLSELSGLLQLHQEAAPTPGSEAHRELYEHFSACRFGFIQALRQWAGNTKAAEGLQLAQVQMVRYELKHGAAHAAAALIGELSVPDEALEREVKAALEKSRAAEARLHQLERDADVSLGIMYRSTIVIVSAVMWLSVAMAMGYLDRTGIWPIGHGEMLVLWGVELFLGLGRTYWKWPKTVPRTRFNLTLARSACFALVGYMAIWCFGWWQDVSVTHTLAFNYWAGSLVWGVLALMLDKRLAAMTCALIVGAVLTPLIPTYQFHIMGVVVLAGMGGVGLCWQTHVSAADQKGSS
jgi:serine/threonine protein kinase